MKKRKIIFNSALTASMLSAAIIPITTLAVKNKSNAKLSDGSTSSNSSDIKIDIKTTKIDSMKYMYSKSTKVTWMDGASTIETGGESQSLCTTIGDSAFAYSKLEEFTIPINVRTIDSMAFYNCENIRWIDFSLVQEAMLSSNGSDTNFKLGSHVFRGISGEDNEGFRFGELSNGKSITQYSLELAYLKAMLVYAGGSPKWNAKYKVVEDGITNYQALDNYKTIPVQLMDFDENGNFNGFKKEVSKMFDENSIYDSIIFPRWMTGMTETGYNQFAQLKNIENVKTVGFISNPAANSGVTKIESKWFRNWSTLENIILPSNVKTIEPQSFSLMDNVRSIDMSETSAVSLSAGLFENSGKANGALDIKFPKNITSIDKDVFTGAAISHLDIPEGVTNIEANAFNNCKSLRSVTLSSTVATIGDRAFAGCDNLEEINFDYTEKGSLTSIGDYAFSGASSLTSLKLPKSLFKSSATKGNIGKYAFATSESNHVKTLDLSDVINANVPNITFGEACFTGWSSRGTITGQEDWTDTTWNNLLAILHNTALLGVNWNRELTADEKKCLVGTFDEGTTLTLNPGDFASVEEIPEIKYSYDLKNWTQLKKGDSFPLDSTKGNKIYFKGLNKDGFTKSTGSGTVGYSQIGILNFKNSYPNKGITIDGNIMGLVDGGQGKQTTLPNNHCFDKLFFESTAIKGVATGFLNNITEVTENCYQAMFYGCTNLEEIPALPATKLAKECYYNMFKGCTKLTETPKLQATEMAEGCYKSMFNGCTSLSNVVEFGNVKLAKNCFESMYANCTSLVIAPELPKTDDKAATKVSPLAEGCYKNMFNGCTSLTSAPKLPALEIPKEAYMGMFANCTSLVNAPRIYAPVVKEDEAVHSAYKWGDNCYSEMFMNCKSLKKIEVDYVEWPKNPLSTGTRTTLNWVKGVPEGGKFVLPYLLPHADGGTPLHGGDFNVNQIPEGWEVEEKDKPREDDLSPMAVTCKKETEMYLVTGAGAGKRPILTVERRDRATQQLKETIELATGDSSWTSLGTFDRAPGYDGYNIKIYKTKSIKFQPDEKLVFKAKQDRWGRYDTFTKNVYPSEYTSFMFVNPNDGHASAKKFSQFQSTGVSLWGNCMSLILNQDGSYKSVEDFTNANYAFYGLFAGLDAGTEYANDSSNLLNIAKKGLVNYCMEDFKTADTFFAIPKIGVNTFGRCFSHCYNLTQCSSITSKEGVIRAFSFFDTFCGCKSLVNGPEKLGFTSFGSASDKKENAVGLPSWWNKNARSSLQGLFVNCANMVSAPELCFKHWWEEGTLDGSDGYDTFYRMFDGCKKLKALKLNFDPSDITAAADIKKIKTLYSNRFWLYVRNLGKTYTEATYDSKKQNEVYKAKPWLKPTKGGDSIALKLYITSGFYNWVLKQFGSSAYVCTESSGVGNLPMDKTYKWRIYDIASDPAKELWLNQKVFPK